MALQNGIKTSVDPTKNWVAMHLQMQELERRNKLLEAEVQRLKVYRDYAYTDVLTEIPNRRFFHERLIQEIARSRRGYRVFTLAMVDIDHFKIINEQNGHSGGDQVLKFFAQFLRANLRQEDVLCRIGGDEFAILLLDTPADLASIFVDRVRNKLSRLDFTVDGHDELTLSFSCGLAESKDSSVAEDLINEADQSLFAAKASGRNCVVAAAATSPITSQAGPDLHKLPGY